MAEVITLNKDNFKEVVKGNVVLIDFYSPCCGPCRKLLPILDQVAEAFDGKVKVAKVDATENCDIVALYGITAVPTMILLNDYEELGRMNGAKSVAYITEMINNNL